MSDLSISESSLLIPRCGVPLDHPDNRRPYQKQLAIYFILASTVFERLAFYALAINLVVTLQLRELNWDSDNSITASFIFSGFSYISTFLFAALSDAKLGRAKTIIIGFCLYLIGYIFVNLIANEYTHTIFCGNSSVSYDTNATSLVEEHCFGPIIGTLIFTAIGVGAIQANMAIFGAEQVQEFKGLFRYFDKYVIAVNIGALCGTLLVSYIQDFLVYSNRIFYGYCFAAASLVVAFLLFIMGKQFYFHIEPHDTIITKCIPVVINAFHTWRRYREVKYTKIVFSRNSSATSLSAASTKSYESDDRSITLSDEVPSFLDYARASNNGKYIDRIVDDVKALRRVILVFLLLIPYWLISYQVETTFILQGQQMSIPYISENTPMPAIWMLVADQASTIIGILIVNLLVYNYLTNHDQSVLIETKFITGMILASIAMFIAGTVESLRQKSCFDDTANSSLSIFTQLPQYIGIGISEVFAMVASFEFAYLTAPRSAQSLIMSLRFCSVGLSSFISDAYVKLFTKTNEKFEYDCEPSNQPLYIYFYILGGIQLLTIIIFIICNRKLRLVILNPCKINKRQFI